MKTYIEMLVTRMIYEKLGWHEEIKQYMRFKTPSTFLVDVDLIKERIERYSLEGVSENKIQEFIKKISLIEYYKVIGDFVVVNQMELELKALKRDIMIESLLQNLQ